MWAAATGKVRLPTVASLTGGTTRRLVPAERRALRPGTSTVEVSGSRYRGALPWRTLYVSTARINGESTSMAWPTLGSRTAEKQNRTGARFTKYLTIYRKIIVSLS